MRLPETVRACASWQNGCQHRVRSWQIPLSYHSGVPSAGESMCPLASLLSASRAAIACSTFPSIGCKKPAVLTSPLVLLFLFFHIAHCIVAALDDQRIKGDVVLLRKLREVFEKRFRKADRARSVGAIHPFLNFKHVFFLSFYLCKSNA